MSKLNDMAYMRGRDDARCGLPRFPQCQHPNQYGAYNAGYRDWGKLQEFPAMVEALRWAEKELTSFQHLTGTPDAKLAELRAILARIDGEGGQ